MNTIMVVKGLYMLLVIQSLIVSLKAISEVIMHPTDIWLKREEKSPHRVACDQLESPLLDIASLGILAGYQPYSDIGCCICEASIHFL